MRHVINRIAPVIFVVPSFAAYAQIDTLSTLVPTALATDGAPLIAGTYDPISDTAYTAASILSADPNGTILKRITGVSSGSPVSTVVMDRDQFSYFMRDGDLTRTLRSPGITGLTFNRFGVGTIAAGGSLWITDTGVTRLPNGSTTTDPAATKRVYRYDLGDVPPPGNDYASVSSVLSPLTSMADIQNAAGGPTATTDGSSRPYNFSPDGTSLYSVDGSAAYGGIYRVNPQTGAVAQVLDSPSLLQSEVGVRKVGASDRIFFRSTSNPNGITYIDYNPVTAVAGTETVLLTAAQIKDFRESSFEPVVNTYTTDSQGNLYFYDSSGIPATFRIDTAGRISKVNTRTERDQVFTGNAADGTIPNINQFKLQAYDYTHPTAGAVTRISYMEFSPISVLAAMTVFKPLDFNRDGAENTTDITAFMGKLTARGVASSLNDMRYDMNGNASIDYKDVKILQSFYGFRDGDADMNRVVDTVDFNYFAGNFGKLSAALWTEGDFDGSETINSMDFIILAGNYGQAPLFGETLSLLPGAVVPEPSAASLLILCPWLAGRRRFRKR